MPSPARTNSPFYSNDNFLDSHHIPYTGRNQRPVHFFSSNPCQATQLLTSPQYTYPSQPESAHSTSNLAQSSITEDRSIYRGSLCTVRHNLRFFQHLVLCTRSHRDPIRAWGGGKKEICPSRLAPVGLIQELVIKGL